jgi:hypothetical protein
VKEPGKVETTLIASTSRIAMEDELTAATILGIAPPMEGLGIRLRSGDGVESK